MPIESYLDQLEPANQNVVIWRFMNMRKFADLMNTSELYFCRADLFEDKSEDYPPIITSRFPICTHWMCWTGEKSTTPSAV